VGSNPLNQRLYYIQTRREKLGMRPYAVAHFIS